MLVKSISCYLQWFIEYYICVKLEFQTMRSLDWADLVAGEAARTDGLGMMPSAVESSGACPEVDEVDQRVATLAADEAAQVPGDGRALVDVVDHVASTDRRLSRRQRLSALQRPTSSLTEPEIFLRRRNPLQQAEW